MARFTTIDDVTRELTDLFGGDLPVSESDARGHVHARAARYEDITDETMELIYADVLAQVEGESK